MNLRVSQHHLAAVARDTMTRTRAPAAGLAVADATGTQCAWAGVRMLDGPDVRPDDALRIASVTKSVTAVVAWRLAEEGDLDLAAPVSTYLQGHWRALLEDRRWHSIRVEHLLRHTSGLPDYVKDTDYTERVLAEPTRRWTPEAQVAYALERASDAGEPGQLYHYSDTGYVLLAQVIETAGGAPVHILARLYAGYGDLSSFRWEAFEPPAATEVRVHQYDSGSDATHVDPSADSHGGGGLVANLADLAFWFRRLAGCEILGEATLSMWLAYEGPGRSAGHFGGLSSFDLGHGRCLIGHRGYWGVAAGYLEGSDIGLAAAVTDSAAVDSLVTEALPALIEGCEAVNRG